MKTETKNRLAITATALMCGLAAWAMPTRDELVQAQKLVQDLTADDVRALNARTKKPGEVAAAQLALADEAETEAGKYLLLQGAFKLYARSADYDAAADALARMRKEIADLPPEVVVELVNGEMRRVAAEKAPKVLVIFRDAQRTIRCRKELAAAENAVKAKPGNVAAQRRLAECHAGLGDWAKALEIFAQIGDEAAKYELDPSSAKGYDALKAANYWWEYQAKDDEPFKVHAAVLYKKGLDDGSISGLRKTLAEKRVNQMESVMPPEGDGSAKAPSNALYCVIDLSAGPNASKYPVSYLAAEPKGGWTDEYKTTKLVLRRIDPGTFKMGGKYEVTLTKSFYCGVFEVTQKQYELVTGSNPSKFKGDMRPVEKVSWNMIRGDSSNYNWPTSKNVDPNSFMGKIQAHTGLSFDLPTEAQWEYACRAGTMSKYNNGGDTEADLKKLGRFILNQKERGWKESDADFARHEPDGKGGFGYGHTVVGSYVPNAWGLYDMHGNVWEWCLDWRGHLSGGVTDPQGSPSDSRREQRGGGWFCVARECASSYRSDRSPSFEDGNFGFRLCMNPDGPVGASAQGSGTPAASGGLYCVVDLSAGPNASKYPVKWLAVPPTGGFNVDEYKTNKLVLRRIDPGKFLAGGKYEVTLTKPFWCGVFEVTQKQYELVTGNNPSKFQGDMRPVESVSWNMVRGDSTIHNWPTVRTVASDSFVGRLGARTGLPFDLPTEAQWEYACRAGTTSKFNNGGDSPEDRKKVGRFRDNRSDGKGGYTETTTVGSYLPNAWGLYDMHGNVQEWCLDWFASRKFRQSQSGVDPEGPAQSLDERGVVADRRVCYGGTFIAEAPYEGTSFWRLTNVPSTINFTTGFRLCMNPN